MDSQRTEQKTSNPDILGLLRKESASPPIQAKGVVGAEFKESSGLRLENSFIQVVRTENSDGTKEYMACLDIALSRSTFATFLDFVSPHKLKIDRESAISAINDDWSLPDRPRLAKLNDIHLKGPGEYWEIFGRSRKLFMKILGTPDTLPALTGQVVAREACRHDFLYHGTCMNTKDLIDFFSRPVMAEVFDEMLDKVKPKVKFISTRQRELIKDAKGPEAIRVLSTFGRRKMAKYLRRLFRESSPEVQNKIVDEYIDFKVNQFILRTDRKEPFLVYGEKVKSKMSEHITVSDRGYKINFATDVVSVEGNLVLIKGKEARYVWNPGTLKRKYFIKPLMHWTRKPDGERKWHFDFVERQSLPSEIASLLDRDAIGQENCDPRLNSIIGLLAVAYFSPEITKKWPKKVSLPDSIFDQPMGPAQVPILAMMHAKGLLNGEFLAKLEAHAESSR